MRLNKSDSKRFWSKVEKTNSCWNWTGSKKKGYGSIYVKPKEFLTHRLSYMILVSGIPDGMTIDHLCRNRACLNPKHLEMVTLKENILRGNGVASINARKTHCKRGHKFSEDNILIQKSTGGRICRVCKRDYEKESYHKNKPILQVV